MKKGTIWILVLITMLLASGCGKFESIAIHGMKNFKFRGMKDGSILVSATLDIENPNNKRITISSIHFKTWLKNRELGTLKNSNKIVLKPNSREEIVVPIEIKLRTAADAFKLMTIKEDILNQLTIEGFIKGRVMCISKKMRIEKQPFSELAKSYKEKLEKKDSLKTKGTVENSDSLKIE